MLDEAWLEGVQFDSIYGRINGILGIGGSHVVFNLITSSGVGIALKMTYPYLAYAIRELPPGLTLQREYNVERLNRKLLHLVGNPIVDAMTGTYDDLYKHFVKALDEQGVAGLLQAVASLKEKESVIFLLHTPGMERRLQEDDSIDSSKGKRCLRDIKLLPLTDSEVHPEKLPENPLYVWGAAIMDGFFTDEELTQAAAFLTEHYGPLAQHPQAHTFTKQIIPLVYLLEVVRRESVFRFVQLCNMVGLLPEVADVLALPGEAYLWRGQLQAALAIFNRALALDNQDVKALMFRGETFRQMDHFEEALTDLNKAIALDPQNAEAITYRGETYLNMGSHVEALAEFDRAIARDPQNVEALANRGESYRVMGRYQEALADFDQALSLDQRTPDLFFVRALTYRQIGRNQEALADLDQVIDLSEISNVEALVNRALIYAENERYLDALSDLDSAIIFNNRNTRIPTIRGKIYFELERYEEALADFDSALTLDEQNIEAIIGRGFTYARMERYQEALTDLDKAISLEPQNFVAIANRGKIYSIMGRYQEALDAYEQALQLDPNDTDAYNDKGWALWQPRALPGGTGCL
jgi:tetratricopeptide (TPR) repeat protein